jgi:hypothetical protein
LIEYTGLYWNAMMWLIYYISWPLLHNSILVNQCTLAPDYTYVDAWQHVSDTQAVN